MAEIQKRRKLAQDQQQILVYESQLEEKQVHPEEDVVGPENEADGKVNSLLSEHAMVPPNGGHGQVESVLTVQAIPLKKKVLVGVKNCVPVLLHLKTVSLLANAEKHRAPFNLVIVFDRSGSMSGAKLENSKLAVLKIMQHLQPNKDVVHFVCYGSMVEAIFENQNPTNKAKLIQMINRIQTEGCTNLSGGLEAGINLLNKYHQPGFSKRVFLLSDGYANEGETSVDGVCKIVTAAHTNSQIRVDSFGIGDFDAVMIKNVAEFGSGSFYFINSAESIPDLVGKALDGLLELVGQDALLRVKGEGCGIVAKMFGSSLAMPNPLVSGVRLGDLSQNDVCTRLFLLEVSPTLEGPLTVLQWEVTYAPHDRPMVRIACNGELKMEATRLADEIDSCVEDVDVKDAMAVSDAAESDQKIQMFLQQGKAAEAVQEQQQQNRALEVAASKSASPMLSMLFQSGKQTEQQLQSEGCSSSSRQQVFSNSYSKGKGSLRYVARCKKT